MSLTSSKYGVEVWNSAASASRRRWGGRKRHVGELINIFTTDLHYLPRLSAPLLRIIFCNNTQPLRIIFMITDMIIVIVYNKIITK